MYIHQKILFIAISFELGQQSLVTQKEELAL
jgi:hypothetical protein